MVTDAKDPVPELPIFGELRGVLLADHAVATAALTDQAAEMERLKQQLAEARHAVMEIPALNERFVEDATKRAKALDAAEAALQAERERVQGLEKAGGMLSNIAYNLAQWKGEVLTEQHCKSLDQSRRAWDDAMKKDTSHDA